MKMKKSDIAIIAGVLILSGISAVFLNFGKSYFQMDGEARAEIYIAGELIQTVLLAEETRNIITADGKLILTAEKDGVFVSYAECPSQDCVHTGKISEAGQIIACLPNRVIIKIAGNTGKKSEVDIIAE